MFEQLQRRAAATACAKATSHRAGRQCTGSPLDRVRRRTREATRFFFPTPFSPLAVTDLVVATTRSGRNKYRTEEGCGGGPVVLAYATAAAAVASTVRVRDVALTPENQSYPIRSFRAHRCGVGMTLLQLLPPSCTLAFYRTTVNPAAAKSFTHTDTHTHTRAQTYIILPLHAHTSKLWPTHTNARVPVSFLNKFSFCLLYCPPRFMSSFQMIRRKNSSRVTWVFIFILTLYSNISTNIGNIIQGDF